MMSGKSYVIEIIVNPEADFMEILKRIRKNPEEKCIVFLRNEKVSDFYLYDDQVPLYLDYKSPGGCPELIEIIKSLKEDCPGISFDKIEFMGFGTDTDILINACALKAVTSDTPIAIYNKGCRGTSGVAHKVAIEAMRNCGIEII